MLEAAAPAARRKHGAMNSMHKLEDRGHDLYETPPVAVRALLEAEPLPQRIWEPSCGPGSIVRVLREAGHTVFASDLIDYGCEGALSGVDFLTARFEINDIGAVVGNPPYKHAQEFVQRSLDLGIPKVVMLLRLAFLSSERRRSILEDGRFARAHVFRNRLPMMHRHDWAGNRNSSATDFAWLVWCQDHSGPATINRISWRP